MHRLGDIWQSINSDLTVEKLNDHLQAVQDIQNQQQTMISDCIEQLKKVSSQASEMEKIILTGPAKTMYPNFQPM